MKIGYLQYDIRWLDTEANLQLIADHLEEVDTPDLLVLPEMFTSGFDMSPEENAKEEEELVSTLCQYSETKQIALIGSVSIQVDKSFRNRVLLIDQGRLVDFYDKNYLFTPSGENQTYQAGERSKIFKWRELNICPQVCYDLRFPEGIRNHEHIDLLIYMANWPSHRINHWTALLKARAIENQCYVVGCNRIGKDQNGWDYCGESQIIDYKGDILVSSSYETQYASQSLEFEKQAEYRTKLPFLEDRRI